MGVPPTEAMLIAMEDELLNGTAHQAALNAIDQTCGWIAAGAWIAIYTGAVAGTIAYQWTSGAPEVGDHQFPRFTIGNRLLIVIYAFDDKTGLDDMWVALGLAAFNGHRSDFCHARMVINFCSP